VTDEPMVERLTALEAAATPGPWESFVDFGNQESHVRTPKWSVSLGLAARTADAALIVAMRNDLPALLSQLREQRERAERAEKDRDYWRDDICETWMERADAAERTVREQREALERVKHYALRHVGTDSRAILALVDAALAPDTEGEGT